MCAFVCVCVCVCFQLKGGLGVGEDVVLCGRKGR